MAKSKKMAAPVDEAAELAKQRMSVIRDFNANNAGNLWIDPDKTPTEDDVKTAKEEFEARAKALQEKEDYLIADKENSLRVAKFIRNYIATGFWVGTPAQRFFVGVINICEFLDKFIAECETCPKDLVMGYGPMQFCYIAFENYSGNGLEGAKKMAEIWDEYIAIYDTLRDHIEWYKKEVDMCNKLNDRWGLMEQGFYMVILNQDEIQDEQQKTDLPTEAE